MELGIRQNTNGRLLERGFKFFFFVDFFFKCMGIFIFCNFPSGPGGTVTERFANGYELA